MHSFSQRLLISVTLLLLLFFGVMVVVLDARFRDRFRERAARPAGCADGGADRLCRTG